MTQAQTTLAEAVEEQSTPEEAAAVTRTLGYFDGWADQWSAENNIADQVERMFAGRASAEFLGHIVRWSKQCFAEGCYRGYCEAKTTAETHIIEPLRKELSALQSSASIPEGCVVVPVEPSDEMLNAAHAVPYCLAKDDTECGYRNVWKAMLAASPTREGGK